ncbi:MAG: hypothetical protein ACYTG5_13420 [Planctomycetota bacterium]|jgi:hypothetical protein
MLEALEQLGQARELILELFLMLPKSKRQKMRERVEAVAPDLLDED